MNIVKKDIEPNKKIYFISDAHLGIPDYNNSLKREKLLVKFLDDIKNDAQEIYLLGDIFDFWFEYKYVVPKGYVRLLGKLAELTDAGITVNFFTGNHDMWIKNYFKDELNLRIYKEPIMCDYNNKIFFIAHGDGLGRGDISYKLMKRIFSNRFCKWLFARLHPNFAFALALLFSRRSRLSRGNSDNVFLGKDKERLILYAEKLSETEIIDFFIFGHRHLPMDLTLSDKNKFLNIGDWFSNYSYIVFDGEDVSLKKYITP